MHVCAYIPCYNNRRTLARAIRSVREQQPPVDPVLVVDDGSTDGSASVAASLGVRVVVLPENRGRGFVRRQALDLAPHELVLACDATMSLAPDFLPRALEWIRDSSVAAVFGRVIQPAPASALERWRGRHLFKMEADLQPHRQASLATGGVLLRQSQVRRAGNFNPNLRQGEDADLGTRLLALGCQVVFDPRLRISALENNSLSQLLERYRRWNLSPAGPMSLQAYLRHIRYSIKVMARADLRHHDPISAAISVLCPHYLFWKTRLAGCEPSDGSRGPQC